jgi:hypothetical protein
MLVEDASVVVEVVVGVDVVVVVGVDVVVVVGVDVVVVGVVVVEVVEVEVVLPEMAAAATTELLYTVIAVPEVTVVVNPAVPSFKV